MQQLNSLSDRLLNFLAPKAEAKAACPAPYYKYRCYYHDYQRSYCSYIGGCLVYCNPWQSLNQYCV